MMRRFTPPWRVHRMPAGFRVADANGCWLAYVYGDLAAQRVSGVFGLSGDQAALVALAIADLPALLAGTPTAPIELPAAVPGPWIVEPFSGVYRVLSGSIRVACVYYSDAGAGDLTEDEARRIAGEIARIPALVMAKKPEA